MNDVLARHPVDRSRVYVAGLSAGGALAAVLAEQAPDVFAAVGIVAGVALHASHDVASAFAAMRGNLAPHDLATASQICARPGVDYERARVTIWTGVRDRVVSPLNTIVLAEQFRTLLAIDDRIGETEAREDAEIVRFRDARGRVRIETWQIPSMGHAWSGGSFRGSHTHPRGPRASDELMAFFLEDPEIAQSRSPAGRSSA